MAATVGQTAPDFSLPDHRGGVVTLSDLRGRPVVVFFFPKAFTPVCTKEACAFRDAEGGPEGFASIGHGGVAVLGVSSDSVDRLREFAERHRLGFLLLSDADGRLRASWGVPRTFGIFPGRVTYVLDRDLVVREAFSSPLGASAHVRRAAEALRRMP